MFRSAGPVAVWIAAAAALGGAGAAALSAEMPDRTGQGADVFDLFDENHDGRISNAEFQNNKILVFYVWDRNRDLVLTPDETPLRPEVFARAAGPDGRIDSLEFITVIDEAFLLADANRDSTLDRQEFAAIRQRIRP
ncbi:EF-hand domain-containing protein [Azospirillum isscasi]|uniref:EF-hand domain-containing protein n=1 Tax=Azospirillum isscasi TaxID=3053926 RepID=A0ABU0WI28_9PROT|nr:hypothetical protein [Azospirillum isscasi]MDQ2103234.1 hypothetical protein [Azospirillum isscasi]